MNPTCFCFRFLYTESAAFFWSIHDGKSRNFPVMKSLIQITLAVFIAFATFGGYSAVGAQDAPAAPVFHALSDGQFVYGPNIGAFDIREYLTGQAPHLLEFADGLYGRAEYYSINPKIYLTLLEICCSLVSTSNVVMMEDPFGLPQSGLLSQIESISDAMMQVYYLHLYSFSVMSVEQRSLPSFFDINGVEIPAASEMNAGTYALLAGLSLVEDQQAIYRILDHTNPYGFYQTYIHLFPTEDPLDESNRVFIPGDVSSLAAPDYLLQLPYLLGVSWKFGGVHNTNGTSVFTDASSLDFYPVGSTWGIDTSSMWVVSAASGTLSTFPSQASTCGVKVSHGGVVNTGWETTYYHLENVQKYSGPVAQNEKIGVLANTLAEATCVGGSATGPHVHFSLKYNGAYYPINGTPLSGWYVHAGRYSYDVDPAYMWLERSGVKKYAYSDLLTSEAPPSPPSVISIARAAPSPSSAENVNFLVTFSESVSGVDVGDFTVTAAGISGAVVAAVSGSGSIYTVTVNTGNGNGTIRLDLVDNNSILDAAFSPLGGAAVGDGSFNAGEVYTIEKTTFLTDTWAVKLSPAENPDQLAVQLGGQNLGQIGSLPYHYLFLITGSQSQPAATSSALASNPNVLWYEQQIARLQSKRGQLAMPPVETSIASPSESGGNEEGVVGDVPALDEDLRMEQMQNIDGEILPVPVPFSVFEEASIARKETRNHVVLLADEPEGSSSSLMNPMQLREPSVFMALSVKVDEEPKNGILWFGIALFAAILFGLMTWKVLGLIKQM